MDLAKVFVVAIILVGLLGVTIYIVTPPPPEPTLKHRITIDTHGINAYSLTIKSNSGTISETVVNYTYSIILDHGEYFVEACYWNVNLTQKCEGQRIWLDEDLVVDFFVDVID